MKRLMTSTEASKFLHVHTNTLRRWSGNGMVKSYVICSRGDRRYKLEDLTNYLNNGYNEYKKIKGGEL
jgi:predicted site-specific integrase-resolvase